MTATALSEVKERLILPAVSSCYPTLGANYKKGSYEIDHANKLVRTGEDY